MGVRESLLNTITSVSNGDFIRVVTAAGASSKATLANLMKSFETGLGSKSSLTTSDYIRVVGSDNTCYKQQVSNVKTAMGIDALASKIATNAANTQYKPIFGQSSMTFSSGTATLDLSSIATATGVTSLAGVAFAVANNTGTVSITGASVNTSTKVLTVRAQASGSAYSGTITANYLVFGN